ncbi:ATP-dependent RNA helicase DbpA [Pseudoalteromonas carrageenovora]|uniref:DEAD-box ATP-dependent RNA helicase RhpA n=1 Tax=Pseudoalteromonas carrageenovora IAM 12662 TaxID=1314868 RepID=A0A2K4XDH5_PSEVC|nr:ATP-dependent RNA helicase DbpA [Pseudoalteromonas carrageenovora]MBE0382719.1 ATP-independent RNA helicase DbpA [Pseudoalteromonas carrageenovora IAM 12662]MCQ8891312.1 ATP-dependent RNA helicase DbpA [Pseudoalteromonas carrageenovora]MDO6464876.1 ATP-dependent RNA helicase DbpA [Pseudoalteromonas carrageenovora]MDO6548480.1 ATP-dependent RNA helicase DbpA [Pseudoalteromonas carrageenovora]MDO6832830.1 ATP-dependent RNA helicase DbpA [Pseudoalteromonas carrageenovora]
MTSTAFSSLALPAGLVDNLSTLGYSQMTPVQAQSLPPVLEGKDIIAQAKTGSGKTAAFSLGVLAKLNVKRFRIQSLVLCPTRELAEQVAVEMRKLARGIHNIKILTLCGGVSIGPQIGSLEHGAHIIVGTPGRVDDHIRKGTLRLDDVETLVLDEADQMLDMGFQDTLDAIIERIPQNRQTLLFSATFPRAIEAIAKRVLKNPEMIKVEEEQAKSTIKQYFYKMDNNKQRYPTLKLLLLKFTPQSCVVFCNTKVETQQVCDDLADEGFSAVALHGDLEQRDRERTLIHFANKSASILVATDVAARGLDIDDMDMVINYHLAHDTQTHVHRVGRTGRAGKKGIACSIYGEAEAFKIAQIGDHYERDITPEQMPPFNLLDKPPYRPEMVTLMIDSGKKQKVRAGDILGALTGKDGIAGRQVGKINVLDNVAFVAVERNSSKPALRKLTEGNIKGRKIRARRLTR